MKNRFSIIAMAVLTMGLLITPRVKAGDAGEAPADPEAQPQAQSGVGRLNAIHGDISIMHANQTDWVAGAENTPIVPGDRVATADGARAEMQLDYANIMRLDQHTDATVADLEQNKIQIQLAAGMVDYSVFDGTQADLEIDTPNMGVHPLSPGFYTVQVNSPTETLLIVRAGEAEVLTNQGSTKVQAGQIVQIRGGDNPEYKIDPAPAQDDFDKWCMDRDRQIQSAQAWQHTDRYYTGASDLDQYGDWEDVPDYGWCWTPAVDAGWVPYRVGSWGWEPYWGWTWISAEPWGWAPYHYGRWFMYGNRWCWWPDRGFYGGRPVWAPAYVSFFGFGGGGVGGGFGFGSIGWLPLGPRDVFHPWWGAGHGFRVENIHNIHGRGFTTPGGRSYGSNLDRMMTDARMRGAITHVSSHDFVSGRMSHAAPVSEAMLHNASMMQGHLPVNPTRASYGNRVGNFTNYRLAPTHEHFFSRSSAAAGRNYNISSPGMAQRGPAEGQSRGRVGGNAEGFGTRSNAPVPVTGRTETGQFGGRAPSGGWRGYQRPRSDWPTPVNGPSTGSEERNAAAPRSNQRSWDRYASPNPYAGRRQESPESPQRGGWQGYSREPGNYQGGQRGWNAPAPRSEGSYGRGNYRPPLELNNPVMRQRAPSGGNYGGGRNYSAPSGGGRYSPAPRGGGGGRNYSAPRGGGGGGSHGGGGGHSGGGHGGGGRR